MKARCEWWELRMPRTKRDSIDARIRMDGNRMTVVAIGSRVQAVWSEAIMALKWAQATRLQASPAYPWRRVGPKGAAVLEALYPRGKPSVEWRTVN